MLKSKGVPVLWVGLPAIRGQRGTSDMLYLDALYRDGAGKAGITYVDIWDGFVDEAGRFLQKGPDFEGQIRQLRTADGVFFTKAGARKLAHYVEREVTRLLAARSGPIAVPIEPVTPDANVVPGQPAPRPLAGPVMPLVASTVGTDQLLGGPGTRPASVDALAARTLVKGEPLARAGRPRRRLRLAAPRDRPRAGPGRYAGSSGNAEQRIGRGCARDRSSFCCRRRSKPSSSRGDSSNCRHRRCRSGRRKTTRSRRCATSSAVSAPAPRPPGPPPAAAPRGPAIPARRARRAASDDRPKCRRAISSRF